MNKALKYILTGLYSFSRKEKLIIFVFLFCMGLITYLIIPLVGIIPGGYVAKLVSGLGIALIFAFVYFLVLMPVMHWNHESESSTKSEIKTFMFCFLSFFSVCLIFLLAYYPGVMSGDSFTQWTQMETFKFNDWHPVFSTLYNWAATRIWYTPAAVALLNSLFFSLVFASTTVYLKSLGIDRRIIYLLIAVVVLNPVNGIMAVTIWKDIPYTISILWLTLLTMKVFYSDGLWMGTVMNKTHFVCSLVFSALLRHNGIIPVILVLAALFIFYRKHWRNVIIVAFAALSVIILIKGPVYSALNVEPGSYVQSLVNPIMQVGGIISGNGKMTENEIKVMTRILPLEKWKEGYKKYSEVPLMSMKGFNSYPLRRQYNSGYNIL